MKRRLTAGVLTLVMTLMLFSGLFSAVAEASPAPLANGPDIYGESYCVLNADTGEVVTARDPDRRLYPASTTKTMTCLLACERGDLNSSVTFSDNAVNGISIHSSTLEPKAAVGETMSLENVLYGLMLVSGNECAVAVAEAIAGSEGAFVDMMNQRAGEIGASNTHFMNPHGLHDDEHYTTTYDMCLMYAEAIKNPTFRKITSTGKYQIPATNAYPARDLSHGHMMVSGDYSYPCAVSGKSGQTPEAGRTLVTYAEKDGMKLIVCVFKSTHQKIWKDTQILFEYGFDLVSGACEPMEWTPVNATWKSLASLNIREFPNTCADIVGTFADGDPVQVIAQYGAWSQIDYNGMKSYVQTQYLKDPSIPETEPPTEPETEAPTVAQTDEVNESEALTEAETEQMTEPETNAAAVVDRPADYGWMLWAMALVTFLLAGAVIWFIVLFVNENMRD